MRQLPNLDGSNAWLCNNLKKETNYLQIDGYNISFNLCQMTFLKLQYQMINKYIINHISAKKSQWFYDRILQANNVSSGLTFLLQIKCQNPD
jgi:hypothetical protein